MSTTTGEFLEATSITFEWTIKGLKTLFESSRGEAKSRVTRSARFGGGKWQILFYANSGEGNFVSLYLNCEPTQEENDNGSNRKWVREGLFKFSFELRNTTKTTLFNMKEACDHTFSYRTQNWGWAQFSKRDHVYYGSTAVRQADSFVVICTITSSPTAPTTPSRIKKRLVPTAMLDVVGSLLDDPTYSDIEFVFPDKTRSREGSRRKRPPKRIWACKKLLTRADYFDAMFNSGFSETSAVMVSSAIGAAPQSSAASEAETNFTSEHLHEDSDLEEEAAEAAAGPDFSGDNDEGDEDPQEVEEFRTPLDEHSHLHKSPVLNRTPSVGGGGGGLMFTTSQSESNDFVSEDQNRDQGARNNEDTPEDTNRTPSRTLTTSLLRMNTQEAQREDSPETVLVGSMRSERSRTVERTPPVPGPPKVRVVVNDVAYSTYRAVLYYLYTDTIVFAPLASSFFHRSKRHSRSQSQRVTADLPVDTPRDGEESMSSVRPGLSRHTTAMHSQSHASEGMNMSVGAGHAPGSLIGPVTTRVEWIKNWAEEYPGRPVPCSAKAVYRLADKLDLGELKERARDHIVKSLTITNVPHEVFSSFSATFEELRKVQIDFFLANWGEIRGSQAMANVWQQIRTGRHPGFEEVWPLIAQNLEYRATLAEGTVGDGEREVQAE